MALNTITPSNREEEYLSAIAGDEGASAPVPSNRREEWLRRIAEGQGEQTERLDHIEDQLPVYPAAADVGKVMTVVADTSGEEPVYKWSAEESKGNADKIAFHAVYTKSADVPGYFPEVSPSSVSDIDKIRDAIFTPTTSKDIVAALLKYIHIYVNGSRALPTASSISAGTNYDLRAVTQIPAVVSGVTKVITMKFTFRIFKTDSPFIKNQTNSYTDETRADVPTANISNSAAYTVNYEVFKE